MSRGTALPFHDLGTQMGVGGQHHAPAAVPPGKYPVPIVQEAGQGPGPVWTGAENLAPHRDSIPVPPNPQRVAIPTELSRPPIFNGIVQRKECMFSRDNGVSTFKVEDSKLKMEAVNTSETMAPSTDTSSCTTQNNNVTYYCFQMQAANRSLPRHIPVIFIDFLIKTGRKHGNVFGLIQTLLGNKSVYSNEVN